MKGLVCQAKDEKGMFGGGEEQRGDQATRGSLKWTPQGQVGCVVGGSLEGRGQSGDWGTVPLSDNTA